MSDTAGPSPPTPQPQDVARRARPWWKKPVAAAAVTCLVSGIAVCGYLGVKAVASHSPARSTSPLTSDAEQQVAGLPPGAAPCERIQTDIVVPFNAGARGTPTTSCGFVEQVRKEYSAHSAPASGPVQLSVISPATFKTYRLACFDSGTYVTCTGGAAAVIYLYNSAGSR